MEDVCALNIAGNEMGNTICKDLDIADVDDDGVLEIVAVGFTYNNVSVKGQLRIWNWKGQTRCWKRAGNGVTLTSPT